MSFLTFKGAGSSPTAQSIFISRIDLLFKLTSTLITALMTHVATALDSLWVTFELLLHINEHHLYAYCTHRLLYEYCT
jgi:hypothetical protein